MFKNSPFQPNRIVFDGGNDVYSLLSQLESRDPAFHAVVAAELKKLQKENNRDVALDYAALRKQQLDAAAATQKTSASAAKK